MAKIEPTSTALDHLMISDETCSQKHPSKRTKPIHALGLKESYSVGNCGKLLLAGKQAKNLALPCLL